MAKRKDDDCGCIAAVNKLLEDENEVLVTGMRLDIQSGTSRVTLLPLLTRRLDSKKKTKPKGVVMNYCPLCGVKLRN